MRTHPENKVFDHGLELGQSVSSTSLKEIFKHNINGGMKRSLETNTLVLISDHYKSPYSDKWKDGILHYNGMGLLGDQKLNSQNKTLAESPTNGVKVYLFEANKGIGYKERFIFMGEVELVGEPYQEKQVDEQGTLRNVYVFPLRPVTPVDQLPLQSQDSLETVYESEKKKIREMNITNVKLKATSFNDVPSTRLVTTTYIERNAYVSEYTKLRAKGICDLCEEDAPFYTAKGIPYLETHHIDWLSLGGKDSIENTVALCPNCHRKMHSLNDKRDVKKLKDKYSKRLI